MIYNYSEMYSHDLKSYICYMKVRYFSESFEPVLQKPAAILSQHFIFRSCYGTIGRDCTITVAAAGTDLDELRVESNHQDHAEEES